MPQERIPNSPMPDRRAGRRPIAPPAMGPIAPPVSKGPRGPIAPPMGMPPSPMGGMAKPMGMKKGGKLEMVKKDGKSVPAFAADGVGKMNMGGMMGYKKGGKIDGIAMKGKTKGRMC
jgi:hypothetical protein